MIVQSVSAEERQKGIKGVILGNANFNKPHTGERAYTAPPAPKPAATEDIGADVPF